MCRIVGFVIVTGMFIGMEFVTPKLKAIFIILGVMNIIFVIGLIFLYKKREKN